MMNKEETLKKYYINTSMGKVFDHSSLPFLSDSEFEEFNIIGYTGKDNSGKRMNYESFLNTLNKGIFFVKLTKHDNGDFSESFLIIRKDSLVMKRRKKLKKIINKI
jgi:hypothetical protein